MGGPNNQDVLIGNLDLEFRVVEAAVTYVRGVGYDGNSPSGLRRTLTELLTNYNELIDSTKALIAAREADGSASKPIKKEDPYQKGREDERREIVIFLRNHARWAGFVEMFGGYNAQETLELKARQIENGYKKLAFNQTYEESEAIDLEEKTKGVVSIEEQK